MKPDIHPDYVVTTVTCTCGNTFATRSTATSGEIHADVCSQCHPFYTGKQKILDTGGRVARFEARFGKKPSARTERRRQVAHRGAWRRLAWTAPFRCPRSPELRSRTRSMAQLADESRVRPRSRSCSPSTPSSSASWPTRPSTPTRPGPRARPRYAELDPDRRDVPGRAQATARRLRRRQRAGRRGRRRSPREAEHAAASASGARGAAAGAAGPARPERRQGRHPRDQGGRGRRGVGAVRRRPAADVPALRRAAAAGRPRSSTRPRPTSAATRTSRVAVKRPRRAAARRRRLGPAEVRGRRAPRAAGAGHRVAGPDPHLGRRRAGAARGRGGRGRRSTRTTCASTCSARPGPAARASTPPTPRCGSPTCRPASSCPARTRRASCRTRSRRCASCAPGCSPPAQEEADARGRAPSRRSQVAHGGPVRADPHLQLPGEPDLRPPRRLQGLQPGPGARRRPRRGDRALVDADSAAKLAGPGTERGRVTCLVRDPGAPPTERPEPAACRGRAGGRPAGRGRGGLAARRRRGAGGLRARRAPRRAAHRARRRLRRAVLGGVARRANREPLQHITGRRLLPLPRARGRPRGVRAAAGDRGHGRLGDRPAAASWTSPSR